MAALELLNRPCFLGSEFMCLPAPMAWWDFPDPLSQSNAFNLLLVLGVEALAATG